MTRERGKTKQNEQTRRNNALSLYQDSLAFKEASHLWLQPFQTECTRCVLTRGAHPPQRVRVHLMFRLESYVDTGCNPTSAPSILVSLGKQHIVSECQVPPLKMGMMTTVYRLSGHTDGTHSMSHKCQFFSSRLLSSPPGRVNTFQLL